MHSNFEYIRDIIAPATRLGGFPTEDVQLSTFLSIADVARLKGVHYQTVRRAIAHGELPAKKVGHAVIIAAEDLDRWQPHYERVPGVRAKDSQRLEDS